MIRRKPSFFERLTGSVRVDDFDDFDNENEREQEVRELEVKSSSKKSPAPSNQQGLLDESAVDGELTVDVLQTGDEIIIKAMVAGVKPEDLDISVTRDMVTIRGSRKSETEVDEEDYYHRELYWGSFSRTIVLPAEIEVDESSAIEKHGLLEIHLPKIDRAKQAKVKVKTQ